MCEQKDRPIIRNNMIPVTDYTYREILIIVMITMILPMIVLLMNIWFTRSHP